MPSVLCVGAGGDPCQQWRDNGYEVVRLDIDPATSPDIVGTMTDLGNIGPYDAVYCIHALEHLYPHEVPVALSEFRRVLRQGGVATIAVPDLEGVPPTDDKLPGIDVSGLHLYYGDAAQIPTNPHMAHHCGFVASTLAEAMKAAGFSSVRTLRLSQFNLMGIGIR